MKKVIIACFILAGIAGFGTVSSTAAFASGNSDAAHTCQHGGYLLQLGTDGTSDTSFGTPGDCVSYAARGGVVVALDDAQPCLGGGYQGLTSTGGSQAFASEAACVLYIGLGGTPVPFVSTPTLTGTIVGMAPDGTCSITVSGSGLMPGTHIIIVLSPVQSFTMTGPDGQSIVVAPDGTLDVTTTVHPGNIIALSATVSGGGTITTDTFDTSC